MEEFPVRTYEPATARAAQEAYCERTGSPHFAPESGICYSCGRNIYGLRGVTVEEAGSRLVTGCPFCNVSYCD